MNINESQIKSLAKNLLRFCQKNDTSTSLTQMLDIVSNAFGYKSHDNLISSLQSNVNLCFVYLPFRFYTYQDETTVSSQMLKFMECSFSLLVPQYSKTIPYAEMSKISHFDKVLELGKVYENFKKYIDNMIPDIHTLQRQTYHYHSMMTFHVIDSERDICFTVDKRGESLSNTFVYIPDYCKNDIDIEYMQKVITKDIGDKKTFSKSYKADTFLKSGLLKEQVLQFQTPYFRININKEESKMDFYDRLKFFNIDSYCDDMNIVVSHNALNSPIQERTIDVKKQHIKKLIKNMSTFYKNNSINIPYSKILDDTAKSFGYRNYSALIASFNKKAIDPKGNR